MKLEMELSELRQIEVAYRDAVFYIKPLTIDEFSFISSSFTKRGKVPEELQTKYAFEILEKAIVGWKGLQDAQGGSIPFRKEYIRPVLTVLMKETELIPKLIESAMKLVAVVEKEGKKIDRVS